MEIFDSVQEHLPSKYSGHIQVLNVSDKLVRLGDAGPYLMPNHVAVMPWNPVVERSIANNKLLKIDFSAEAQESKAKKSKKLEDMGVAESAPTEAENDSTTVDEVATESEV